ncbi:MAG: hypothetical protein CVV24_09695 [Ignavibacteriae bacterium HGW-Ignavibacteriae-3]|nr:MAG: hypothetical protein CVV24_09695 [Ignavibacteriae bacterium HGW-Ignavibacteriae-3]
MTVGPGNINPSYIEFANSHSSIEGVRRTGASKSQSEEKSFFRNSSEDQKNRTVSEAPDRDASIQENNLRLHHGSPASRSQKSAKSFNETKKSEFLLDDDSFEDVIELIETDDYEKVRNSSEGGYYIIINDKNTSLRKPTLKSANDLWRARINKMYHSGLGKQPGVLVNLLA